MGSVALDKPYVGSASNLIWVSVAGTVQGAADDNALVFDTQDMEVGYFMFDTKHASNLSSSTDVNCYASPDGTNWSDTPIDSITLADNTSGHFFIGRGFRALKFTVDNDDATGGDISYVRGNYFITRVNDSRNHY